MGARSKTLALIAFERSCVTSGIPTKRPLSAAAICIQAGWTMGKVRDVRLRHLEAGNVFIGQCLALLPLMSSNFAVLPPHFSSEVPNQWRAAKKNLVFPFVALLGGVGRLL
jgi:hypothetical protein